jgi:hypothetical protein
MDRAPRHLGLTHRTVTSERFIVAPSGPVTWEDVQEGVTGYHKIMVRIVVRPAHIES